METLTGALERVTYYNPENGYSVLRLRPDEDGLPAASREGLVTVTGVLPELAPGEHLRLQGQWVTHPKHGLQFNAEICEQVTPATVEGIRRYLGSGLIKGIGPQLANRIVDHFGVETLKIIEQHPRRLREVPDIGVKRSRQIVEAWEEQRQIKDIMLFLHEYSVTTNLALKIYRQYGDQSIQVVQDDPYQLAGDIFGVGFKTADRLAQSLGLPADHPKRIEAGIVYYLEETIGEGNVFVPKEVLIEAVNQLLEVEASLIPEALERLEKHKAIVIEPVAGEDENALEAVYLAAYHQAEQIVAKRLRALVETHPTRLSDMPPGLLIQEEQLSEEQRQAIQTALAHPVSVLTGGPGTGKTTAIQALIAALETGSKKYALASPTGRAAKRLSQATDRPASTIHRLLEYSPAQGFGRHSGAPLEIDLLVVDEASMLDLQLANHLLKALKPGTHLLLVGDVDQLPSVGAGDVLRDVIQSEIAPVTRLSVIFRQAAGSHIIENAHRINQGEGPHFPKQSDDFFRFPAKEPEEAADWIEDLVAKRIPERFKLHPRDDIQVIAPMYRGPAGVDALNARLQAALNPGGALKAERHLFGQTYRVGDKVMQIRNDYDKQVFNGDIGFLKEISSTDQTLVVDFEGRAVTYDWSEGDQLVLAYAISVHKSQGSEFPAVVMPILTHHYIMLQRNLLYTAVTRAKRLCVLVGNMRAIHIAVKNNKVAQRYTGLSRRLKAEHLGN
jgi:exodeoxyribonuclease V alpha subunit